MCAIWNSPSPSLTNVCFAANQKDAISDPNNNTKSASSPDDTKLSENETKSNDNKNASTKSHVGEMKKEASNKWKYLTIPDKKHKKKNNKKSYVSQPETSNLDSQYGESINFYLFSLQHKSIIIT